ncbi:MAG: hypothetical protein E7098_05930 [Mediterranea massiliensis]|nr:hypothetical protein [Mediterranea massiliensis]
MKLNQSSLSLLEDSLKKAVSKLLQKKERPIITDIYLQVTIAGEFVVFDDNDEELSRATIAEWVDSQEDVLINEAQQVLITLLAKQKESGAFDQLPLMKPYSFVLVDEEKETIADLLLMDDDTMIISEGLLQGLDEELDAFLKDLLEN